MYCSSNISVDMCLFVDYNVVDGEEVDEEEEEDDEEKERKVGETVRRLFYLLGFACESARECKYWVRMRNSCDVAPR